MKLKQNKFLAVPRSRCHFFCFNPSYGFLRHGPQPYDICMGEERMRPGMGKVGMKMEVLALLTAGVIPPDSQFISCVQFNHARRVYFVLLLTSISLPIQIK